jgi:hypothetical protein
VSWTVPVNPDVQLPQGPYFGIYRAVKSPTTGLFGTFTLLGTSSGTCYSVAEQGSAMTTASCTDTSATAAGTYEYEVSASDTEGY